jgi:hypothetical protein
MPAAPASLREREVAAKRLLPLKRSSYHSNVKTKGSMPKGVLLKDIIIITSMGIKTMLYVTTSHIFINKLNLTSLIHPYLL